jgi:hypothetical protein
VSFSYTGFRFLLYRWPRWRERGENAARIRWAEIYERIVPQARREGQQRLLMRGSASPEQFRRIMRTYGLDVLIVPSKSAQAEAFRGFAGRRVRSDGRQYVLYGLHPC